VTGRYDTSGNPQAEFEVGSEKCVLVNKLGITDPNEMDDIELELLDQLYDFVIDTVSDDQAISSIDLCEWHRRWLGNVYPWAGRYRTVNMGKGDFMFAAADQIPRLMEKLDTELFPVYTPCIGMSETPLATAIATVHIELILVHPFREGNGRLSRLLANVMALQAGWPELDFSAWDENREAYFAAIQAGMVDAGPMTERVRQVLRVSLQQAGN
jgi:cell filamentation protein